MENNKIESLLIQILENQTSMKSDICNLTNKFDNLENKVDNLENKVDKNSLMLEKMQTDIKILAEVQSSFSEQLGRAKDNEGRTLGESLDIIELAVTSTSKSVTELVETIDVIKDTTGSHEMDIKILKKLQHTSFI